MRKHELLGVRVHLGLEGVFRLEGLGTLSRRAGVDQIEQAFDVGILCPSGITRAQHIGQHAGPAPQGHVGLIVEPRDALRIGDPYKAKCIGIHWELMFTRSRFRTADMDEQGKILARVAFETARRSGFTTNVANGQKLDVTADLPDHFAATMVQLGFDVNLSDASPTEGPPPPTREAKKQAARQHAKQVRKSKPTRRGRADANTPPKKKPSGKPGAKPGTPPRGGAKR